MGTKQRQQLTATIYDKRGRVLSVGHNNYLKSHPWQAELARRAGQPERQFLHAEISALIRCRGQPHKISIMRHNREGRLMLAKPCAICELAIREAGIQVVEYSIGS